MPRRYIRNDRYSAPPFVPAVAPGPVPADSFPAVSLSRGATNDDTDDLTRNTVQKMCALIRESATDPRVQQCAAYAKDRFAEGNSDPAALAWGVFWYVKHCVKFRSDEGTMMQVGEHALDLLTAPAVLVRMKDPGEDCDGFTMLSAAMLTILGVPVLVTTVATDLDDPRRWSHVFLVAIINGRVVPLDTSHGKAPGWMVPRDRINRFQSWTLDGKPADVKMPTDHGLHGYVGRGLGAPRSRMPVLYFPRGRGFGGLGCGCTETITNADGSTECLDPDPCVPTTTGTPPDTGVIIPFSPTGLPSGTNPVVTAVPINTPVTPAQAGLTPAQIAQLITATGNASVSLIRTAAGGPYQVAGTNLLYNPATGQLVAASNPYGLNLSSFPASIMNNLPLIGGALLALILLPSLMGGRR